MGEFIRVTAGRDSNLGLSFSQSRRMGFESIFLRQKKCKHQSLEYYGQSHVPSLNPVCGRQSWQSENSLVSQMVSCFYTEARKCAFAVISRGKREILDVFWRGSENPKYHLIFCKKNPALCD